MNTITLLTSVGIFGFLLSTSATIVSTFDTDAEEWSKWGDGNAIVYHSTGGNPGGYVSVTDMGGGAYWYFKAPAKFLGNVSTAYALEFDLNPNFTGSGENQPDVYLRGQGILLVYNCSAPTANVWNHYSIPLDASAGWQIGTLSGTLATAAELQTVLTDVDTLLIRGEFSIEMDTGGLDNVALRTHVPDGGTSISMLGLATVWMTWVSRKRT
jgi:hypothetical protein